MGRGVIARRDIPHNTVVAEYRGTLMTREKGNKLDMERQDCPVSYQFWFPLMDTTSKTKGFKTKYFW